MNSKFNTQEILHQKDAEFWESEIKDMEVFDQNYPESVCLCAMSEYAEKVAVAFAEWKDEVHEENGSYHFWDNGNHFFFESITDLYQYFITNVYNK